jgi:hypothetical protein
MGKNTMMKRSIRMYCEERGSETWAPIIEELVGNVGIVFTKGDLSQVRGPVYITSCMSTIHILSQAKMQGGGYSKVSAVAEGVME